MSVTWIGTRTQEDGAFNPAGLGAGATQERAGQELLTRGSVLIEAAFRPLTQPVNLFRFSVVDPWPRGLTLRLEPDGTLRLLMRHGDRQLETTLRTTLGSKVETAHITYIWDAPARLGHLGVHIPDHGLIWQTEVPAPFPVSTADAHRMMEDRRACRTDPSVTFAAIADAPCPLGPVPGLAANAMIDTPRGAVPLCDIRAGDLVTVIGAGPARVLWAGSATVPALGRFAPLTLRRPYMGLWADVVAARDQRACLAGSEVEYIFGTECVSTAVRHLEIRNCAAPLKPAPPVMSYHQILLDRHAIITVNGALMESFDGAAVLERPELLATSVIRDMPPELHPRHVGLAAPVLQGYEALTLTGAYIG